MSTAGLFTSLVISDIIRILNITRKSMKVKIKKAGNKMVPVEAIFATAEEAIIYAQVNNKKTVWKKDKIYFV